MHGVTWFSKNLIKGYIENRYTEVETKSINHGLWVMTNVWGEIEADKALSVHCYIDNLQKWGLLNPYHAEELFARQMNKKISLEI